MTTAMTTPLETRTERLVRALQSELERQKELLALGQEKQRALIQGDMKQIDMLTQQEEAVIIAVGETAMLRMNLTVDVGKMLSMEDNEISISRIAAHTGEPLRSQLTSYGGELKQIIHELTKVNRQNRALTEQSIVFVKDFMNILGGGGEPAMTYTKRGLEKKSQISRVIIDHLA